MRSIICLCAAAAILLLSGTTMAQVVPPAPGVELPQAYLDRIASDPAAFHFQKAWIEKTRRARETRERYLLSAPSKEAAFAAAPQALRQTMMVSGTTYVPVLMGKFDNTGADPYPTASLQSKLFDPAPALSMTALYGEMSYGNLALTGTVYGWYQVSEPDTYYAGPTECYGLCNDAKTGQYLLEILQMADPTVNFGLYDNDGPDGLPNSGDDDGYVDFVAFVQPEIGAECGTQNIWSHRWTVNGWPEFGGQPYATNDARTGGGFIRILDYTIQPALGSGGGCGTGVIEIGVFCHEFGHAYDLPDLYDGNGSSGIGHWGLMGSGNWNIPTNPAHFDAWCKSQLGWIVPYAITDPVCLDWCTLPGSELDPEAWKLEIMEEKFARRNVNPISGSWSMRCMLTAAEATARNWPGGAGYGNGWDEAVVREFAYDGSNPVTLQYDYACHAEAGYDYGVVSIDVNGVLNELATHTGSASGHAYIDLTPYLSGGGVEGYTLVFEFVSDFAWSDEDGLFNSGTNGGFKFDNVSVAGGGVSYSTGFETNEDGWHYDRARTPVKEYFLVEHRQKAGALFDQALHGEGLVVYHVDQDIATTNLGNTGGSSNNVARGMMLEEADNLGQLLSETNRGDGGDVFPGTTNNTAFTSASAPNSNSLNGNATYCQLTSIGNGTGWPRGGYFPPTLASITPNSGDNNQIVSITSLLGGGFVYGATFGLVRAGMTIRYALDVQWIGKAKLAGEIDLHGLAAGAYDVVVLNPDGRGAKIANAFTVNAVTGTETPGVFVNSLRQNHPNPFNPMTTIRYSIERAGRVRLVVYDVAGALVRTLVDGEQAPAPGGFSVVWDGANNAGAPVASGVYFYRLTAPGGYEAVKKLVLVR